MTRRHFDLTLIRDRANTCFVAGILNGVTRLSSIWRKAWARAS